MTSRLALTLAILAASVAAVWLAVGNRGTAPAAAAPVSAELALPDLNDAMAAVVERVLPTVVSINTERVLAVREPVEGVPDPRLHREPGVGSGVIVTPQGHAITNWHVVSGDEVDIYVTLHGEGAPRRATLVDHDEERDIAVILVDPRRQGEVFRSLPFGDSDRMRPGHFVIALGNPLNLSETVTLGIVSNRARRLSDTFTAYLQTDCVINPGNSGGPLVNLRGELIGINTRLVLGAERSPVSQGYGLAIPSNEARDAFERLMNKGRPRGYLGVTVDDWPEFPQQEESGPEGAVVLGVEDNSPAGEAGLRKDDVVVAFDGEPVKGANSFFRLLGRARVGDVAEVGVKRGGEPLTLETTIGDLEAIFESEREPGGATAGGVTVRGLRRAERSRLQVRGEAGVVVESIDEESVFRPLLEEGQLVLAFADRQSGNSLDVTDPAAFESCLRPLLRTGGFVIVYRAPAGATEWIEFPPAPQ